MNNTIRSLILPLILLTLFAPAILLAQEGNDKKKKKKDKSESKLRQTFVDTTDNAFDVSKWMTELHGFLPLPTLITEPAVGYGINMAIVFFHPTRRSMDQTGTSDRQLTLPSMTAAGGLYTANGTWGVYGGHYGSYLDDRLRVALFTAWLDINLYFFLNDPTGKERQLKFNFQGLPLYASIAYKLGKSKWYAGVNYLFYKNEITLKTDLDIPAFDSLQMNDQLGGLGINVYRQDFDNAFTPNKGTKLNMRFSHNDTWLGSNYQFNSFNVEFLGFGNWWDPLVSGFRVQTEGIFGEFPFYARPFIHLRGIPAMRYQGEYVFTLETEQRFNITPRWAIDGFVGFGIPFDEWDQFGMTNAKWAGGGGFRYLMARWFNMYMGIDVAKGPLAGDWAWYIILGSYWLGR